jgi:hypothetical protein
LPTPTTQQAVALKVPTYDKDVPAVVLVDEQSTTIGSDGKVNEVYNFAVRILRREGRAYAVGQVGYIPDIGKVKDFRAWLIRAAGEPKRYGKDDFVDIAADLNDVYNEYRVRRVSAADDADAGAVFAYSYALEDRSVLLSRIGRFRVRCRSLAHAITSRFPKVGARRQ